MNKLLIATAVALSLSSVASADTCKDYNTQIWEAIPVLEVKVDLMSECKNRMKRDHAVDEQTKDVCNRAFRIEVDVPEWKKECLKDMTLREREHLVTIIDLMAQFGQDKTYVQTMFRSLKELK